MAALLIPNAMLYGGDEAPLSVLRSGRLHSVMFGNPLRADQIVGR